MEQDSIKKQPEQGTYDLPALAEAMLLTEKRLPAALSADLQTLRQMLEDAVKGEDGTEAPAPVPPGYGKTAFPCRQTEAEKTEKPVILREDTAVPFAGSLIALSPRQMGEYVTVPQVVGQGGQA